MTTSVVMTTYNGEKYLQRQLESIAQQSSQPLELIVRDDASKDATVEILRKFQSTVAFEVVVQVNEKNVGFRENFMEAIRQARGEIIAFCDQDDIWHTEKLEKIERRFAASDQPCLVRHNAALIDGEGKNVGVLFSDADLEVTVPAHYVPWSTPQGLTMAIHRRMLGFVDLWKYSLDDHFPEERMAHDRYFYFLATCFGVTAYLPELLASYRIHQANVLGTSAGLKRRFHLDRLWWALTCFRNIEKKLIGLQSRRDILSRVIEGDYGVDKSRASEYVGMIDKNLRLLRTQRAVYRGSTFSQRMGSLRELRTGQGYGLQQDGKIEASNRLTDMFGAVVGPAMISGADRLKSALRGVRPATK
jgi:glycosyltransferase involved in cell wall biosynthesis